MLENGASKELVLLLLLLLLYLISVRCLKPSNGKYFAKDIYLYDVLSAGRNGSE